MKIDWMEEGKKVVEEIVPTDISRTFFNTIKENEDLSESLAESGDVKTGPDLNEVKAGTYFIMREVANLPKLTTDPAKALEEYMKHYMYMER